MLKMICKNGHFFEAANAQTVCPSCYQTGQIYLASIEPGEATPTVSAPTGKKKKK